MARSIEHVVIIVKENHTFDNYFGTLPGADGAKLAPAANPPTDDPDHRHQTWMARAADQVHRVQYGEADIPGYFDLAKRFTVCDRYFSEVAGPSTPNHLMLICADAPIINNPQHHYRPQPADQYQLPSLPIALENSSLTWGNYGGYAFHYITDLADHHGNHTRDLFAHHAQQGNLPTVSWVYGDGRPDLSEHPRQASPTECSGPPVRELWDHTHAQRSEDANAQFDGQPFRFGSRVPCLVLSPYAKAGHICSQENSHVSILKFCEDTFGLGALTERDRQSNGMVDCFDLTQNLLPAP
jgi:phospholipase C